MRLFQSVATLFTSIALLSSLVITTIPTASAQDTTTTADAMNIVPLARHLTIEELNTILATETKTEFDWSPTSSSSDNDDKDDDPSSSALQLWDAAVSHEWKSGIKGELFRNEKYPYILCHTGESMSGYRRQLALLESIETVQRNTNTTTTTDTDATEEQMHFRTIYNSQDYYCVYGRLYTSIASSLSSSSNNNNNNNDNEIIVTPVVPALKYMEHCINAIQGMKAGMDMTIEVNLCPGVALSIKNDEKNTTNTSTLYNNNDDDDDMESMVNAILAKLVPTTLAEKLAHAIEDAYYLTSEEYHVDALDNTTSTKMTNRATLWKNLLNDYQQSGVCNDVYQNRLSWNLERAVDANTGNSQVSIAFNNTGNSTMDQNCILTLTLAIASDPNVCSLDLKREVSVQNTVVQWLTQSELKNEVPFFDVGLDGTGQVISASDTGIDLDNCYFRDDEQSPATFGTNDLARKVIQYVPYVDNADYKYGHGTHVAGSIAGKRIDGEGAADGAAPGAKLAFYDIGDAAGALYLPPDSLLLDVGRPASKIHSMSWGAEFNFYTTQSRNFDQYMYENDDFLILVAAGNSGAGDAMNTVGSPATAKNVIAVGSHHSFGSSVPTAKLGPAYVSDFSSRGPTSDGRMKPDILAVGHAVVSAGALPDEEGECDPSNGKVPGPNGHKAGLLSLQGTSMATPLTAGHASLIRQYFEEGYYPTGVKGQGGELTSPSAALIKAILMNGAQFLKGVDNTFGVTPVEPYDFNQGFGHLSLQNSIYLPGKTNIQLEAWDRETVTDGSSNSYEVVIDTTNGCSAEEPLSVTLVWSEEASSPGCLNCLLHDLDLTVDLRGVTYYPNNLGGPDRRNNAERVIIDDVQNGDVATITVNAHNLARFEQKYSLVATGCFGGVANQLYANGECSVFDCDNSKATRLTIILCCTLIPLAIIIFGIVSKKMHAKKQAQYYEDNRGHIEEGVNNNGHSDKHHGSNSEHHNGSSHKGSSHSRHSSHGHDGSTSH